MRIHIHRRHLPDALFSVASAALFYVLGVSLPNVKITLRRPPSIACSLWFDDFSCSVHDTPALGAFPDLLPLASHEQRADADDGTDDPADDGYGNHDEYAGG